MKGNLYTRGKSRTWYLRYDEPSSDGAGRRQKNVCIGNMSKTDAEARMREVLRDVDQGSRGTVRRSVKVSEFLDHWLVAIRQRVSATTYARYSDVVKHHISPVIGNVQLSKVTPEHVRRVHRTVLERGLSNRTCLHVHRSLHTAFNWALREERIVKENVCALVKAPRPEVNELPPMSRDKVRLLIDAARDSRLEAPVALAAVSGLRRGETLALRWQNIDLDKGSLFVTESLEQTREFGVRFKGPKSKSSRRFVPLSPESVRLLRAHKAKQDDVKTRAGCVYTDLDLVFPNPDGTPWPPDSFTSAFGKLSALVGLKGFRFHDLRHAFASITLADGVSIKEVQTLMGHSSPTVTLSVYARSMEGLGRQAVNDLSRSLLVQSP